MAMPLLARLHPAEAVSKVADALKGPAPLRAGAAAAIGLLPKSADTGKLLRTLSLDSSSEVRMEAMQSLPVLGREALPLLLKAARTGGEAMERTAVETLAAEMQKLGVRAWCRRSSRRPRRPPIDTTGGHRGTRASSHR